MRLRAGVLGHPISHSRSPALHRSAYDRLGLEISYDAHDVAPADLEAFVRAADPGAAGERGERWLGWSVTMPHKADLTAAMDRLSDRVQALGALNTVVWDERGGSTGYNTDVDGIVQALRHAGFGTDRSGGTLGIVGGGGTAAAAVAAAVDLGLDRVELLLRTPSKAAGLLDLAERLGLQAAAHPLEAFAARTAEQQAVVVTLPPRAADPLVQNLPDPAVRLPPLLDVAYDPWPSELALAWTRRGGAVVSGLEMLLYQAVEQVRLFTASLRAGTSEPDWADVTAAMAAAVGLPPR